jgi:hypothetical protein
VRLHHDMLRSLLPVMTLNGAPPDADMAAKNEEMLERQ